MNDAEIEQYLNRILSGYLIFFYDNERYELRYASHQLKYEASLIYQNIINNEKYNEWIREEFATNIMLSLGLWDNNTPKLIQQLEKNIENLKVDLYKQRLKKDMVNKTRPKIRTAESQISRILKIKQDFHANTLEGYASSIKNEYIICNTLYKNNKLIFKDNAQQNTDSYQYFNNLISVINEHTIDMNIFKTIARSNIWRSYWNANKTNIFSAQTIDWTDEQRSLVNITKMYDNIYEHPECPEDSVINDDDMLDGWVINQKRKIKAQQKEQEINNLDPRLKNAQEVFVLASGAEEIEEVLGLNSQESLLRMKEKINIIKEKKEIDDFDLPDVRREAINQLNTMKKQRKS